MLEIYAGDTALKTIQERGFSQELFNTFLGASGGPKWFTLFGLDKYVFGEFFNSRTNPLNIIGSSAGAFRAACFGQNDPVASISRLAENYSQARYATTKPTASEISVSAQEMLDYSLGDNGVKEIIHNPVFRSHFIVAKCRGLVARENKALQILGLTSSFIKNKISRRLLSGQYQRFIYQPQSSDLAISDPSGFTTQIEYLTQDNLRGALLASGSIPLVMSGIENIPGSPNGMYRDGGIIDYHFDIKVHNPGLTLYPHFSANIKAGWFDKNLKRSVHQENYQNTVVICPSKAFIQSLPNQKIPDRTDFSDIETEQRIKNWQHVLKQSEQLAISFDEFMNKQKLDRIKPMSDLIRN